MMRFSRRSYFKWFLYFIYAVILTAVLLVIRFPDEKVKHFIADTIETKFPDTQCRLGRISFRLPLAFHIHDIQLNSATDSKLVFTVDDIFIRPKFDKPAKLFHFSIMAYGEEHECLTRVDWQKKEMIIDELKINQLNLAELEFIHNKLGRKLSGLMDITGKFRKSVKKGDTGVVKGKMVITDGELQLLRPILLQNTIDIKKAEMDYTLNKKIFTLNNGHFEGSRLKGEFAGSIHLLSPWIATKLNLKGKLVPKAGILKNNPRATRIVGRLKTQHKSSTPPFIIKGELGKPFFRFGT